MAEHSHQRDGEQGPDRAPSHQKANGSTRTGHEREGRRMAVATVVAQARRDLQDLLGRPVERVSSVAPDQDGWRLNVEVVELERIPDSTSVLGSYEVVLDDDGEVLEYERTHRYYRNRADGDAP